MTHDHTIRDHTYNSEYGMDCPTSGGAYTRCDHPFYFGASNGKEMWRCNCPNCGAEGWFAELTGDGADAGSRMVLYGVDDSDECDHVQFTAWFEQRVRRLSKDHTLHRMRYDCVFCSTEVTSTTWYGRRMYFAIFADQTACERMSRYCFAHDDCEREVRLRWAGRVCIICGTNARRQSGIYCDKCQPNDAGHTHDPQCQYAVNDILGACRHTAKKTEMPYIS